MTTPLAQHPLGTRARVLLTSVFGPYARDDEYGSRSINPMELYHNQVTRVQGPFSLRMFHRSWGLMLIQANIRATSTLLDFPSLERFTREIQRCRYDIVGISSIIPNLRKVVKMCSLVRQIQPHATIVVGGHVANIPGIERRIDADHIVRGEGISWFRRFLGEDDDRPIEHPEMVSGIGARTMGVRLRSKRGSVAAVVIPSVGCPMGCNFCATSAMFGGKGKFVTFYRTGLELFRVMCRLEQRMGVQSFFIMDENFLLYRRRALELLDLMRGHGKAWSLYVFSSAHALSTFSMNELVSLGIAWVWLGLEGEDSSYRKLRAADTRRLVRQLQQNGIRVLGSSIIGLESHTPENIDHAIDHAVAHDVDFHQFMLYTPLPGTPLYEQHRRAGSLEQDCDEADIHGQFRFNFRHPHISREQSHEFLLRAFRRDFEVNGPSIFRMARTLFQGWQRHRHHPEARVRERFRREAQILPTVMAGALWAMERHFRARNPGVRSKVADLYAVLVAEFGRRCRALAPSIGCVLRALLWREERRLARGWSYEPPTFVERRTGMPARASLAQSPRTGSYRAADIAR
jgi:radical SAM superfamily enzyme YgiQ (UPF0313 family)